MSCGQKWQEESKDGYNLVTQKNGSTLGYSPASGVKILTKGGYAFKDLNRRLAQGSPDQGEGPRLAALDR